MKLFHVDFGISLLLLPLRFFFLSRNADPPYEKETGGQSGVPWSG